MPRALVLVGGVLAGTAMGQVLSPIDLDGGTRVPSRRTIAAVGLPDRAIIAMEEPLGVARQPFNLFSPVLHSTHGTLAGTSVIDTTLRIPFPEIDFNWEMQWVVTPQGRAFFVTGGVPSSAPSLIWTTDGTALGTNLVGTMSRNFTTSTRASQFESWRPGLVWTESGLFWQDPSTRRLRVARGGAQGVQPPADVEPMFTLSSNAIAPLGGRVVVRASNGVWVTDGTNAGTIRVSTLQGSGFTAMGGRVYYSVLSDLWSTDGTVVGTRIEASLEAGSIEAIFAAGDRLYFGFNGTLRSFRPGEAPVTVGGLFFSPSSADPAPPMVAFGDGVLLGGMFQNLSLARGSVLTNLTPAGRSLDVELQMPWAVVAGTGEALRAYFLTAAAGTARAVYRTDGTVAGTVPVDLGSGVAWSRPRPVAWSSGKLYLRDFIGQVWRTFALDEATGVVTEIGDSGPVGLPSSTISRVVDSAVPLFGPAGDGAYRRTAGTVDRTGRLPADFDASAVATAGGVFSFRAATGGGNDVFWSASRDGERTLLGRIGGGVSTRQFVNGRLLIFSAQTIGGTNTTLWAASPQEGVSVVWPLEEGGIGALLSSLLVEGDRMTFVAPLGGVQRMIRTGGTRASTEAISGNISLVFNPSPIATLGPGVLTAGAAIISAPEGVVTQLPLARGAVAVRTSDVARLGGSVIFAASPDSALQQIDIEPAITDGTAAGTRILRDIVPGSAGSLASQFTLASTAEGPRVFFFARDPALGRELWITDGTPEGTRMVVDLAPGFNSGIREETPYPPTAAAERPPLTPIVAVDGGVVFVGDDGVRGLELWRSDGTAAGTVPLPEVVAGPLSGGISDLINVDGTLYFYATGRAEGRELWSMSLGERDLCWYDFNGDENVDLLDAQQMAQVFVGVLVREAGWFGGDLSGDENADLADAQALAQYVVTGVCPL
jgi:ELWxxDGT repeat protein